MRYARATRGPAKQRPYYSIDEIENICLSELRNVGLLPDGPEPIRIDRFVEKRFNVPLVYEDIGSDILGYSKFGPKGVEAIVVSSALDAEGTQASERRLRTTLAHEAGHCLLHAHLFAIGPTPTNLFGEAPEVGPKILCREVSGVADNNQQRRYDGNWWEFQANKAIGALLLPRSLVYRAVEPFLEAQGMLGIPALTDTRRIAAERELVSVFDVNPVVARIRLGDLYPVDNSNQLTL